MSEFQFATQKDIDRADNLNWRGRTFCPMGGDIAISNAKSMAKLIKCPRKILARTEAVSSRWGDWRILEPFIDRVIELWPNSKYSAAKNAGYSNGRYSMSPGSAYQGDAIERIIYNFSFSKGRGYHY